MSPVRIDVTPDGGGEHDERSVLERTLEADRLYVMDRGYAKFALFNRIVAQASSYVCRLRDNSAPQVLEKRPLTEADRTAGLLSDQLVRSPLGCLRETISHAECPVAVARFFGRRRRLSASSARRGPHRSRLRGVRARHHHALRGAWPR